METCKQRLAPLRVGRGTSIITAMAVLVWFAAIGASSAEPLLRVRGKGISILATVTDETGFVKVSASVVTVDGEEQVLLDVLAIDGATQTRSCGLALISSDALESGPTIALHVNLASVQWATVCDEGAGIPSGVIDITLKPDGAVRTTTMKIEHQWLPTYVVHFKATSEDESALVVGQLMTASAPGQTVFGQISQFSTHVIAVERR